MLFLPNLEIILIDSFFIMIFITIIVKYALILKDSDFTSVNYEFMPMIHL